MAEKKAKKTKKEGITRARAEEIIAKATTPAELEDEKLTKHGNKHVTRKLTAKLARLSPPA